MAFHFSAVLDEGYVGIVLTVKKKKRKSYIFLFKFHIFFKLFPIFLNIWLQYIGSWNFSFTFLSSLKNHGMWDATSCIQSMYSVPHGLWVDGWEFHFSGQISDVLWNIHGDQLWCPLKWHFWWLNWVSPVWWMHHLKMKTFESYGCPGNVLVVKGLMRPILWWFCLQCYTGLGKSWRVEAGCKLQGFQMQGSNLILYSAELCPNPE